MRWLYSLCLLLTFTCVGCSKPSATFNTVGSKIGAEKDGGGKDKDKDRDKDRGKGEAREGDALAKAGNADADQVQPEENKPAPKVNLPRKIRYTADVRMVVEDFLKAQEELKAAVKDVKGEIARSEITGSASRARVGVWRIRVPVEQFDVFREAVLKIGEVEQNRVDSDDMTAEYYDLVAYIKNRKAEEDAMNKLLEKTGERDLKAFLEVKRERDAIRLDINLKEGRRRLVADMTDLTTVTVTLVEKQKYNAPDAPKLAEVPTFGMRASKTWEGSWDALIGFGQGLAIVAVAVTPWLPIPLGFAAVVWLAVRVLRGKPSPTVILVEPKGPMNPTKAAKPESEKPTTPDDPGTAAP